MKQTPKPKQERKKIVAFICGNLTVYGKKKNSRNAWVDPVTQILYEESTKPKQGSDEV